MTDSAEELNRYEQLGKSFKIEFLYALEIFKKLYTIFLYFILIIRSRFSTNPQKKQRPFARYFVIRVKKILFLKYSKLLNISRNRRLFDFFIQIKTTNPAIF